MSFSDRLKELRMSRNLTQKQVYDAVGMSAIGYQRYEYGDREPAYQKLLALADYFDVSLDYLCGRSDCPDMLVKDKNGDVVVIECMRPNKN